jgi:hypothetical protein
MKKVISAFSAFVLSLLVPMVVSASDFNDVSDDLLHSNSVNFLADQGVVEGYADGSFGYNISINRAELLKIVLEARVLKTEGELDVYDGVSCFDDIKGTEWYSKYVCFAEAKEWIEGYGDGNFRPDREITFVEAVKILVKANGVAHYDPDHFEPGTPWYRGYVEATSFAQTIPLTIQKFDQIITRSEMAEMVARQWKSDNFQLIDFLGEDIAGIFPSYESISRELDMTALLDEPVYDGIITTDSEWGMLDDKYTAMTSDPFVFALTAMVADVLNAEGFSPTGYGPTVTDGGWYFDIYNNNEELKGGLIYNYDPDEDVLSHIFQYDDSDSEWTDQYLSVVAFDEFEGDVIVYKNKIVDLVIGACDETWLYDDLYRVDATVGPDQWVGEYIPSNYQLADAVNDWFVCDINANGF